MSTTHSSFNQYCVSHKTVYSHQTAAAPGPEVRRECPMTLFSSLPLLATNPGEVTGLGLEDKKTEPTLFIFAAANKYFSCSVWLNAFYRNATHGISTAFLSICPSVCLSVGQTRAL